MIRKLSLAAAIAAIGFLSFASFARAGDDAPAPAAPAAETPKAAEPAKTAEPAKAPEAAKPEAAKPDTKTPSPILSVMFWLGHQVAPQMDCACPAKSAEAEKAWRDWFAGGKDVPAAAIRDQLVADGWNADRFVGFFKEMAAKKGKGDCGSCPNADAVKGGAGADGKSKDCGGACHGKGDGCGGDCHGKCPGCPGNCPEKKKDAKEAPAAPEAPKDAPAKP